MRIRGRLQSWVCEHAPWLSKACWPPDEYVGDGTKEGTTPQSGRLEKAFDREAREIERTVKMLGAQVDVIAGTHRLRVYEHQARRAHQHQRGGG